MRRIAVAGLLLVLAGSSGCASGGSSASSSGTGSGLCDAVASLKLSTAKLSDMQVSQNGVAAMRDQLGVIKTDLTAVIDAAQADYGDAASGLQKDVDALKAAAAGVKGSPSQAALAAVRPPLDTLIADVKGLSAQVAGGCS